MDVILATADGRDEMFIDFDMDIEVGGDNTFEIAIPYGEYDKNVWKIGKRVYAKGTEFGGLIGEIESRTVEDMVYVRGYTWRGLVSKKRREPTDPPVSWPAAYTLGDIVFWTGTRHLDSDSELFNPLQYHEPYIYIAPSKTIPRRAANILTYLESVCSLGNCKFVIRYEYDYLGEPIVGYGAEAITNYSTEIEFSEDENIKYTAVNKKNGTNYLWCMGSGTGSNRTIILLHVMSNGKIEQITSNSLYPSGTDIVDLFDFPNAESADELKKYGIEHLEELRSRNTFDAEIENLETPLLIGDYISGKDYITGQTISKPITRIIYKRTGGEETIEYSINESYATVEDEDSDEE